MPRLANATNSAANRVRLISRLGGCSLAVLLGSLAAVLLLALAGGRPAQAAPAAIDVNPGESIQAAIDAASPGETILIHAGLYTESLTLNKAVSLTGVSSATVIIHAIAGHRVLTATGALVDSSVVISGLSFTGGEELGFLGLGGGVLLAPGAQPHLENLRVYANAASFASGGIAGNTNLPLVLKNVVVQSNTVGVIGGGMATFGRVVVTGGLIADNTCTLDGCNGAGIFGADVLLTGTQLLRNTSRANGGALFASAGVTLTGASLVGNACTQDGCMGAGLYTSSTLTANNTQLLSNTSRSNGGGAAVFSTTVLSGALFQANSCTLGCFGGGLYGVYTATINGSQFISNASESSGGGLHVSIGEVRLIGGRFERNTCALGSNCTGGGIYARRLVLTGTTLVSNTSSFDGAGAYVWETARLNGGLFQSNACQYINFCHGGGLYATDIVASGTHFVANRALSNGGGAYAFNTATVSDGLFQANTCLGGFCDGGGGLYARGGITLTRTNFISNVSQRSGGAVYGFGSASVTGGLFQDNACLNADCAGGGLYTNDQIVLTDTDFISNTAGGGNGAALSNVIGVYGGLFQGNRCTQPGCTGGALGAYGINISGTQLISNSAQASGGAVAAAYATVVGSLFERNACHEDGCFGGGLRAFVYLAAVDAQFISNTARLGGGAARGGDSTNTTGVRFQGNTCTQTGCSGGGLYADGVLVLSHTDFLQNSSQGNGGGAFAAGTLSGTASVTGGQFASNACLDSACSGGGLYTAAGLDVSRAAFLGNTARGYGGAISQHAGASTIVNSLFARNSAPSGGAALHLASDGAVNIQHTTIASPTLGASSAIEVITGTVQIYDTLVASYSVGLRHLSGTGSVFEDYNLFYGVASQKVGPTTGGTNDLSGDPRFANPAGDNYHLRPGSAAIDSGADVGVASDFDGDARPQLGGFDVGYDEFVNEVFKLFLPLARR